MIKVRNNWEHLTYALGETSEEYLEAERIHRIELNGTWHDVLVQTGAVPVSDHGHAYDVTQHRLVIDTPEYGEVVLNEDQLEKVTAWELDDGTVEKASKRKRTRKKTKVEVYREVTVPFIQKATVTLPADWSRDEAAHAAGRLPEKAWEDVETGEVRDVKYLSKKYKAVKA